MKYTRFSFFMSSCGSIPCMVGIVLSLFFFFFLFSGLSSWIEHLVLEVSGGDVPAVTCVYHPVDHFVHWQEGVVCCVCMQGGVGEEEVVCWHPFVDESEPVEHHGDDGVVVFVFGVEGDVVGEQCLSCGGVECFVMSGEQCVADVCFGVVLW